MQKRSIQLPASWLHHLEKEFQKPYMKDLKLKLQECKKKKITIYPEGSKIFNASL